MYHLSTKIKAEVKEMLPDLRAEVKKELSKWKGYTIFQGFYSDESVLKMLPYAAYEYMLIYRGIAMSEQFAVDTINGLEPQELRKITIQALRHLVIHKQAKNQKQSLKLI